jgi:microcystin-dependent protein
MASPPTVSTVFVPNTIAESGEVNQNFSDLISWITANAMQRDGSVSFSGIPSLPSTMPSNVNHAVRKGYVDAAIGDVAGVVFPVGSVIDYVGLTAPEGWALLDGQTLTNAESLFPQLWAVAPSAWRSGSNIVLPNAAGRVAAGFDSGSTPFNAIGKTGGSRDSVVVDHTHSGGTFSGTTAGSGNLSMFGGTSTDGLHRHSYVFRSLGSRGTAAPTDTTALGPTQTGTTGTAGSHSHTVSVSGANHTHSFSGTVSISSAGVSGADKNLQPYLTLNKIIKVG